MAVCFPRCVRIFGYGFSKVRAVHERRENADFKRRGGRWGTVWYVGAMGKNIRKKTEYTRSRLKEDAMPIQLIISLVPLYGEPAVFARLPQGRQASFHSPFTVSRAVFARLPQGRQASFRSLFTVSQAVFARLPQGWQASFHSPFTVSRAVFARSDRLRRSPARSTL